MRTVLFAIACVAAAQSVATRDNNVYFTDARGQRMQLTSSGGDLYPVLAPDGRHAAFIRIAADGKGGETQQVCVVEVGLGEPPPVCASVRYQAEEEDPLAGFSKPLWAADGRSVFFLADFSTETRALCRFDVATGVGSFVGPTNRLEGELKSIAERIGRL
jgi:hypothetical protein